MQNLVITKFIILISLYINLYINLVELSFIVK
jgi:hypothetical protein